MNPLTDPATPIRNESGFTLIEMVIAMALGTFLLLAAFAFLGFTTNDVARITARAEVDRTGRTALENIMLELHSACVAPSVVPIQPKSSATTLRFISETSPINTNQEPASALTTVKLHEIIYTPAKGAVQGTLSEKMWSSTGTAPTYTFNEGEKPLERKLLTGVKQSGAGESTPIFRYYRYYKEGDKSPEYGILDPNATTASATKETEDIAKVTINFTLAPEGHEYTSFGNDRPVELEDSTVFRLATSSEAAGTANLPCTQQT